MSRNRRDFFRKALSGAGVMAAVNAARSDGAESLPSTRMSNGNTATGNRGRLASVHTPDLTDLPFTVENGVKVFHLVAEPVQQSVHPYKTLNLWGYSGSSPGPTIQANQEDRVRIIVENRLPEPTSMHWHGLEIPANMDGVPGIDQDPIPSGGTYIYEFTLNQEGTFFYHSHMAMQEMAGMIGAFIIHPKKVYEPRVDQDFVLILQEFAALPNNTVPNTMSMEYNWLTFNGKASPATTPLIIRLGNRVRIRLINMGMDHHPIHLHGNTFCVTGTEAGRAPRSTWRSENTVLVGVAQARDVEFDAKYPGDWMVHCHLPHHMMNQMASSVGPMTRMAQGMPAGGGMEEGMGMLKGAAGAPMGDEYGPSLGRALGVGSTNEQAVGNGPQTTTQAHSMMPGMAGMDRGNMSMPGMTMSDGISSSADRVPGFPQDAYMEGPMMAMDKAVEKPENFGLRPGWSGYAGGMMTFVRVLAPDDYEKAQELIRRQRR